jgi:hypothetical protein
MATLQNLNFVPTSIAGCQLWLDGRDPFATGTAPVNGTNISTWLDKSGNGRNFSNSLSASTYSLTENGLVFNGTNLYTSAYTASVTNETLFFVLNSSTQPTVPIGSSAVGGREIQIFSATQVSILNTGVAWGATTPTSTISLNSRFFGTSIVTSGSNTQIAVNGSTSFASSNITAFSAGTTQLGREISSTGLYSGLIHEVLSYNSVLSTTNRQIVEGYLAWKWGLQGSLPSTHPYKLIAPNSAGLVYPSALTVPVPTQSFVPVSLPLVFFNPTTIAGCQLWLDGTDPAGNRIVPANGATISTWTDKSGAGNSATGGTAVTYNTTGINNSPVLSFSGTPSYFNSTDLYSNRSFSVFLVSRRQAANNSIQALIGGTTTANNQNMIILYKGNTSIGFAFYGSDLDATIPAYTGSTSTEPAFLFAFTYTPGSRIISVNGTVGASDAYATNLTAALGERIGTWAGAGTGNSFSGFIGEILVYNAVPTTTSRQSVEGYLAWKWGLVSSLPSNHPYKTSVPGINLPVPIYSMQPVSFRPTQISGLQLWLDGADPLNTGILPATSSTIATWVDKSGNGRNATGGVSPTYTASRGVTFNGSTQYLTLPSAAIPSGNSPSSYFVVVYPTTVNVASPKVYLNIASDTNVGNGYLQFIESSSVNVNWSINFGGSTKLLGTNAVINQFALVEYIYTQGVRVDGYLNGAQSLTSPVGSLNIGNTNVFIGGNPNQTWWWYGSICEILIYNQTLSTNQRQSTEGYLAWKWGLVGSLPATHPFKKFPPPPS